MDIFHFTQFENLKYVDHTIVTYSDFQWATDLSSEKIDSVIIHLLEACQPAQDLDQGLFFITASFG